MEAAILEHLPYGAIFDSIYAAPLVPCSPPPRMPQNWYGEDDSAIWTGHYLAAEAFRYAAAVKQADAAAQDAALARIN